MEFRLVFSERNDDAAFPVFMGLGGELEVIYGTCCWFTGDFMLDLMEFKMIQSQLATN